MNRLYLDTETTGLVLEDKPFTHADQPRLVQFGAILVIGRGGLEIAAVEMIVQPVGFEIPAEATAIHGITTAHALEHGNPLPEVLTVIAALIEVADEIVGQKLEFDKKVLCSEFWRCRYHDPIYALTAKRNTCTKRMGKAARLPLPDPHGDGPSLSAMHAHFFGESFAGRHTALADARATRRVHEALLALLQPLPGSPASADRCPAAPAGVGITASVAGAEPASPETLP